MAVNVSQPFHRTSAKPIDDSLVLTLAKMKAMNDNVMPDYYFAVCEDDGCFYLYDKSATPSAASGKFTKLKADGDPSSYAYISSELLNTKINNTKDILISKFVQIDDNTIVPTEDDLIIGKTIISDNDGTFGIVVDIKNHDTASVLTTNAGPGELTSTQISNLVEILN